MSPDDPRHGTEAGHTAHRRAGVKPCAPCLNAHRIRQNLRQLYPSKVPSRGSQRRIQALQAIGHGRGAIAKELGYTDVGAFSYLMRSETMLRVTADRIAEVYDRLAMIVPEGPGPSRARTWARKHGFAPPLAWDDIDNDDAPQGTVEDQPQGRPEVITARIEDAEWLAEEGMTLTAVVERLGVKRETFRDGCRRAGRSDLYWRLADREPDGERQRAAAAAVHRERQDAAA